MATVGYTAKFHCYSKMPYFNEWSFNNGPLPSDVHVFHSYIAIPIVSKIHEGEYECNGVALKNPKIRFVAVGRLEVTG